MSIGERIGLFANEKGINLRQLALKAGISYNTLYSIVKRKSSRVDYETTQRIADALEISLSELVGMNPAVDIPENRAACDAAAKMLLDAGIAPGDKHLESDEDRISFFYKQLNTDGMLAASKCFLDHLKSEDIKEVADYVEKLAKTPQYQRPQEAGKDKK